MIERKNRQYFFKWVAISFLAIIFMATMVLANLSNKAIAETNKNLPIITIDSENFENPPNAVLGKEYKIFSATAVDAFGEKLPVETSLYMYYYSPNASSVSIENGKFIPLLLGEYTVEYLATDMVGNKAIKTYNFACVEKAPLVGVLSDEQGETLVGEKTELPTISYENSTGEVNCSVSAIVNPLGKVIKQIDVDNFIPEYVGEYTIIYKFQDYMESGEVEYSLTVKENESTKLYDEITVPKYFILGCSYKLPTPNFVTYVSGKPCNVVPKVSVKYGGELAKTIDVDNFIPEKEGDIEVIYSAIVNGKKTDEVYFAKVVDVKFGKRADLNKYFYSDYAITTLARTDVTITTATPDSPIDFINPILAERTSMTFKIKNTENFFTSFDIFLTDSVDSSIKVKFSLLKKDSESSYFSINEEKGIKTDANFYDGQAITFNYSNSTLSAFIGEMTAAKIKKDLNGNEFLGFPSGKVFLSFSFGGLNKQSSVIVSNINGQSTSKEGDQVAPQTIYTKNEVIKTVGDTVILSPILVCDVLNPNYSVEYSVLDPDNNYAVDVDGVVLAPENTDYSKSYSILLTKYGSYIVEFKVVDGFGNEELYSYGISVEDMEGPAIYINGYINGEKKVGQTISIPKATTKDNLSKKCKLVVYYMDGIGEVHKLSGDTLKLTYSGKYTIYYYATDEVGNVSFREISFNVVR